MTNSSFSEFPLGPTLPLTTPKCILRDFVQEDIADVIAIASHSKFSGYRKFHLGYFIHPEYQGRGFATEALHSLLEIYFLQHPSKYVNATVHPRNLGSQKVLKNLGFAKLREQTIDVHGTKQPRFVYSVDAEDFKKAIAKN